MSIEEGAYLLFPIIPFFNNAFGEDPWGSVSEEQRDASIEYTAVTFELGASLDGTTLTNLLYTSGQRVTSFLALRGQSGLPAVMAWWRKASPEEGSWVAESDRT